MDEELFNIINTLCNDPELIELAKEVLDQYLSNPISNDEWSEKLSKDLGELYE